MTTRYAVQGGSRILNATRVDQSGSDNTGVVGWTRANAFILAVNINSGTYDTVAAQYKLRWRVFGGTFADVGATGAIKFGATDLVNGTGIAVGGRKCSSVGGDFWQTGYEVEGTALSTSVDLADEYETELHFSLSCADAATNTTYELELYDATLGVSRGSCGATITTENLTYPYLSTSACTSITHNTATANGNITALNGANATRRGFCYMPGTGGDPTVANSTVYEDGTFGTGVFSLGLSGLSPSTGYRVRAYAINTYGTGYGSTVQLTTSAFMSPDVLASRFLLDSDRSSLSASDNAGVVAHAKTVPVVLATAVGNPSIDTGSSTYKLMWKQYAPWTTMANMNYSEQSPGGCGTTTEALAFGGYSSPDASTKTEIWNGVAWATTTVMNVARYSLGSCGVTSGALAFGGFTGASPNLSTNEKWSGTSWATTTSLLAIRSNMGSCGITSAALAFGGASEFVTTSTEKWSGSAWATTTVLSVARYYLTGCGSTSAALALGGNTGNIVSKNEKWSGTSWATAANMNIAKWMFASCGTTTDALAFGGATGSSQVYVSSTEIWDGSAWTVTSSLNVAKSSLAGCGTTSAALSFAGTSNYLMKTTERMVGTTYSDVAGSGEVKWSTASGVLADNTAVTSGTKRCSGDYRSWATSTSLLQAKCYTVGCGTVTDALNFGGYTGGFLATTEKWAGSAWATTSAMPQVKSSLAGFGTTTDALATCGTTGAIVATTHKWSGSSWATTTASTDARYILYGCGVTSSALNFGGTRTYTPSVTLVTTTEVWAGSSWATTTALNEAKMALAGCGTSADALCFGGLTTRDIASTEKWSGTAWATAAHMNQTRAYVAGCGTTTAAMCMGGHTGSGYLPTTELWASSFWATASPLNQARYGFGGCGTSTDALSFGGYTADYIATTEKRLLAVWQDGLENLGDNLTGNLDLGLNNYSELQWGLTFENGTDGAKYEFVLFNVTGASQYVCLATIAVVGVSWKFLAFVDDDVYT